MPPVDKIRIVSRLSRLHGLRTFQDGIKHGEEIPVVKSTVIATQIDQVIQSGYTEILGVNGNGAVGTFSFQIENIGDLEFRLLEDGSEWLLENGNNWLLQHSPLPSYMMTQDDGYLVFEDGGEIILEGLAA
jgi:hypothetical protein